MRKVLPVSHSMTNEQFGARAGVSESMASRLRNGQRLPGAGVLSNIIQEFDLDPAAVFKAYSSGAEAFSAYLKEYVFRDCETTPAMIE